MGPRPSQCPLILRLSKGLRLSKDEALEGPEASKDDVSIPARF
jgi:hypothetical protein